MLTAKQNQKFPFHFLSAPPTPPAEEKKKGKENFWFLLLRPQGADEARIAGEPMTSFPNWRRRWDLNPRRDYSLTAFRVRRTRPLCDSSKFFYLTTPSHRLVRFRRKSLLQIFNKMFCQSSIFDGKCYTLQCFRPK